jgi:hypothetical protein
MTGDERRAIIRRWLERARQENPDGDRADVLWQVCNLLWQQGDPVLPEPLPPGRVDAS